MTTYQRDLGPELGPTIGALYEVASDDPQAFVARLQQVAVPAGGWTVYGAHRLVLDRLGDYARSESDDNYRKILAGAVAVARQEGLGFVPAELDQMGKYDLR